MRIFSKSIARIGLLLTISQAAALAAQFNYFPIDVPGGKGTLPLGINNLGEIVGTYVSGNVEASFLRRADGSYQTIKNSAFGVTYAFGINDLEQITGFIVPESGQLSSFVLDPGGTYTIFPNQAFGINTLGQVVGAVGDASGFLRSPDGTFSFFSVPGAAGSTMPYGINDSGTIVGSYGTSAGVGNAFVRDKAGNFQTFVFPGSDSTVASGINDQGAIVGYYVNSNLSVGAYLRTADGQYAALDAELATGINQSGEIIGTRGFDPHGFLYAPVPEPVSFFLIASGLSFLVVYWRVTRTRLLATPFAPSPAVRTLRRHPLRKDTITYSSDTGSLSSSAS